MTFHITDLARQYSSYLQFAQSRYRQDKEFLFWTQVKKGEANVKKKTNLFRQILKLNIELQPTWEIDFDFDIW